MKHVKILQLAIFVIFIYSTSFAQPIIKGQKTAGGTGLDQVTCMVLTKDGGLIEGGISNSPISGEKTESVRGEFDYWIIKYDSLNNVQWNKTIGGSDYDGLTSIQQTSDGGYILGGLSQSNASGEKTDNNRGGGGDEDYDMWIVKLNGNGKIQWDKTIGGTGIDILTALQQTTDGGYILGGYSSSNISGEKKQDNKCGCINNFSNDYWIVKINAQGNIQWSKTIGGNLDERLYAIQQTKDGGYILGGWSRSGISGDKTDTSRGIDDYWIVKTDNLGNVQWDKTIGGIYVDELSSLQQTTDDGYILGGSSNSEISGEKTQGARGGRQQVDYWVVKLDAQANIEWDRTLGGNLFDNLTSIKQTTDGGYLAGGYSLSSISGEKTENSKGTEDFWVVKLADNGRIKWDKTIGGNEADRLYALQEKSKNRYVLAGFSFSTISGDKTENTRGASDYWFVDLFYKHNIGAIATMQNNIPAAQLYSNNKDLIVYPNPAKDILHIRSGKIITVSLTDQSGKVLLTRTVSGNADISLSNIPAGLYYLKDNTNGHLQKIIVTK